MSQRHRGRGEDHDPAENLPDGIAHAIVLREYSAPMPDEEDLDDDLVGPSEVVEYPRVRKDPGKEGKYKPGDELPLELAGRIWDTPQSKIVACFDDTGSRIDTPHHRERGFQSQAERAINEWGRRRFDEWTRYPDGDSST